MAPKFHPLKCDRLKSLVNKLILCFTKNSITQEQLRPMLAEDLSAKAFYQAVNRIPVNAQNLITTLS